jgi:hypothetical protein
MSGYQVGDITRWALGSEREEVIKARQDKKTPLESSLDGAKMEHTATSSAPPVSAPSTCAALSSWIYGPEAKRPGARSAPPGAPPPNMKVVYVQWANSTIGGSGPVQCAILRDTAGQLYLVFRGTKDPFDWRVNIGLTLTSMPSAGGLKVHGGMLAALQDVSANRRTLLARLAEQLRGCGSIIVTGHSLGGGYAVIAAAHFLQLGLQGTLQFKNLTLQHLASSGS